MVTLQTSLEEERHSNAVVHIQMKEWFITLNKKEYPLALCQIEGVALKLNADVNEVW